MDSKRRSEASRRDDADQYEPCSLCGRPTIFRVGGGTSAWYLCAACVGTPEAEAAGYAHPHDAAGNIIQTVM